MRRVTGLGGVFFKSADPERLSAWYEKHLGLEARGDETPISFAWRDEAGNEGMTIWGPFPADTKYFAPSTAPFMLNYRVDDLDALLAALREEGVTVDDKVEEHEYGRFGWVMDPEGNRIELWEPAKRKLENP